MNNSVNLGSSLRHSISLSNLAEKANGTPNNGPTTSTTSQTTVVDKFEVSPTKVPPMVGTQYGMPSTPQLMSIMNNNNNILNSSSASIQFPKAAIFWDFENCPPPRYSQTLVIVYSCVVGCLDMSSLRV